MSIISASRRTDLPRFHLDAAIEAFERGYAEVINPFNNKPYRIDLHEENVHCIVWWSKDYSAYLKNSKGIKHFSKFNQLFQFTINGYSEPFKAKILEPGVTSSLEERIGQAGYLAHHFSPEQVLWRFDPIVFWNDGLVEYDNLFDFPIISQKLGAAGIKRCHIAFADQYSKFKKRAAHRYGSQLTFHEESLEKRKDIAKRIALINEKHGITTYSCAHDAIVDEPNHVFKAACIDADLINRLFNLDMSNKKDVGQRVECGCAVSKDIGRYDQLCKHCCVYCYANPDDR